MRCQSRTASVPDAEDDAGVGERSDVLTAPMTFSEVLARAAQLPRKRMRGALKMMQSKRLPYADTPITQLRGQRRRKERVRPIE